MGIFVSNINIYLQITIYIKANSKWVYLGVQPWIKKNHTAEKKLWTDSHKRLMELWNPTFEATKNLSNLYWKLLLTWLLKTSATMTTTIRHSRDNGKMADRAQKQRALTKFIQTYID